MEKVCTSPEKCVKKIHQDNKNWIIKLEFANYEIDFINHDLLKSTSFNPYTEKLFNLHNDLEERIHSLKNKSKDLITKIKNHDNVIGGIVETNITECDSIYKSEHQIIKEEFEVFEAYHMETKKMLINFACEILKYKKK